MTQLDGETTDSFEHVPSGNQSPILETSESGYEGGGSSHNYRRTRVSSGERLAGDLPVASLDVTPETPQLPHTPPPASQNAAVDEEETPQMMVETPQYTDTGSKPASPKSASGYGPQDRFLGRARSSEPYRSTSNNPITFEMQTPRSSNAPSTIIKATEVEPENNSPTQGSQQQVTAMETGGTPRGRRSRLPIMPDNTQTQAQLLVKNAVEEIEKRKNNVPPEPAKRVATAQTTKHSDGGSSSSAQHADPRVNWDRTVPINTDQVQVEVEENQHWIEGMRRELHDRNQAIEDRKFAAAEAQRARDSSQLQDRLAHDNNTLRAQAAQANTEKHQAEAELTTMKHLFTEQQLHLASRPTSRASSSSLAEKTLVLAQADIARLESEVSAQKAHSFDVKTRLNFSRDSAMNAERDGRTKGLALNEASDEIASLRLELHRQQEYHMHQVEVETEAQISVM